MSTISLLNDSDVRVVYDNQGVKREVLIGYDKYQEIMQFIERYAHFYSQEVQGSLRASEEDLKAGRYIEVKASEIDTAVEWLHE